MNDLVVDFLREEGFWDHLISLKPVLGKDNGKDWRKLNGILILAELLHVGKLARVDKEKKNKAKGRAGNGMTRRKPGSEATSWSS